MSNTNNESFLNKTVKTVKVFLLKAFFVGLALVILVSAIYLTFAYSFSYSQGEGVGVVQKVSHKGWVCKTWEGEQLRSLAASPTIGSGAVVAEKFMFSVRDEAVVEKIKRTLGTKVSLVYEQHKGLPSCFGDTQYFVVDIKPAP